MEYPTPRTPVPTFRTLIRPVDTRVKASERKVNCGQVAAHRGAAFPIFHRFLSFRPIHARKAPFYPARREAEPLAEAVVDLRVSPYGDDAQKLGGLWRGGCPSWRSLPYFPSFFIVSPNLGAPPAPSRLPIRIARMGEEKTDSQGSGLMVLQ